MNFNYTPQFDRLRRQLDRMFRLQIASYYAGLRMEQNMSKAMDDLIAEVAAEKTVIDSAITLIEGFSQRLTDAGVDATKLAALVTDMQAEKDKLAASVAANTPAAPPTV